MNYSEEQVREIFFEEMREIFESIDRNIVAFENDPADLEVVRRLFRDVHTLKGSSGVFGFREISELTHFAEDVLDKVREGAIFPNDTLFAALLRCFDRTKDMMRAAREGRPLASFDNQDLKVLLEGVKLGTIGQIEKSSVVTSASGSEAFYEISMERAYNFFIMGIDPGVLILNCKDASIRDFRVQTSFSELPSFSDLDAERCFASFKISFVSAKSESEIREIFEFAAPSCLFSMTISSPDAQKRADIEVASTSSKVVQAAEVSLPPASVPVVESSVEPVAGEKREKASVETPTPGAVPIAAPMPPPTTPPAPPSTPPTLPTQAQRAAPVAAPTLTVDQVDYLRIRKEKLDQMMNLVGELITVKNLFVHLIPKMEAVVAGNEASRLFKEGTGNLSRLSSRLQESVMNARMVPIGTVFSKYSRLVRDVSKKLGKKINLVIEGEDTELDKTVSEAISDPLMHLLRNAIDHGIEAPDVRLERGKPEFGTVFLRAGYEGNNVKITVRDDGNGIDTQRIREKVLAMSLATVEQLDLMQKREVIDFIFHSGFTTASEITDVSGRGVGMDVVRNNIRKSGGSILIESELGKGTEFKLILPLSLAVVDALLVGCDREVYAVPQEAIIESVKIRVEDIGNLNNQPSINLRDEIIPVLKLSEQVPMRASVLDEFVERERKRLDRIVSTGHEIEGTVPIVIVQLEGIKVGIQVDTLFWQEQIMIKPLGGFLSDLSVYAGACIMGNGDVVLVLEPKEIYERARLADLRVDQRAME